MRSTIQTELFAPTLQQQFDRWKETKGGAHVLRLAYRITANYARAFQQRGQRVAVALVWELLRQRVAWVRRNLKARGVDLSPWRGFAFNNNFRAYVARHMMAHRPDWAGLFETRELGAERKRRRVIVIDTDFPRADAVAGSTPGPNYSTTVSTAARCG